MVCRMVFGEVCLLALEDKGVVPAILYSSYSVFFYKINRPVTDLRLAKPFIAKMANTVFMSMPEQVEVGKSKFGNTI